MIRVATFPADRDLVEDLFREYQADLGLDLGYQNFEDELAELPGRYAEPAGRVWIAELDAEAVGCVAVRPIDDHTCELKRMYVRPSARGRGLGAKLLDTALAWAREQYAVMKLDSDPSLESAMHLYRARGFSPCERYNDDPHECTVFMELDMKNPRFAVRVWLAALALAFAAMAVVSWFLFVGLVRPAFPAHALSQSSRTQVVAVAWGIACIIPGWLTAELVYRLTLWGGIRKSGPRVIDRACLQILFRRGIVLRQRGVPEGH